MISVLLTTYNSAPYIKDSIYSILNQTYKGFEFVIIDDGSTDNTENIITGIRDSRIRYYKIEHVGRSKALNYGLKICNCDWVALIDADDIAHPRRLEMQYSKDLVFNNIVVVSCVYFWENRLLYKIDVNNLKFPKDFILHQKFPNSVLYNRRFILRNGGYNDSLNVAEDYDLWLRIMSKADFRVVNDILMFYRQTPNALSRKNEVTTNSTIYKIQEKYYHYLNYYFGINNIREQNIYRGWREYFFGNPKLAQKFWLKKISSLINLRIFLAFFLTFLPQKYINDFKKMRIKLKLKFIFDKLLGNNKKIQIIFDETLKTIKNY